MQPGSWEGHQVFDCVYTLRLGLHSEGLRLMFLLVEVPGKSFLCFWLQNVHAPGVRLKTWAIYSKNAFNVESNEEFQASKQFNAKSQQVLNISSFEFVLRVKWVFLGNAILSNMTWLVLMMGLFLITFCSKIQQEMWSVHKGPGKNSGWWQTKKNRCFFFFYQTHLFIIFPINSYLQIQTTSAFLLIKKW